MKKFSRLVAAASAVAFLVLPSGVALAQGAPAVGSAPAPAATSPAPEAKAPEDAAPQKKMAAKKKKPARATRQQEIDRSIDSGTVPARYRNSVPKEYHQYIPFDKQ
jgi:hypothetical protein